MLAVHEAAWAKEKTVIIENDYGGQLHWAAPSVSACSGSREGRLTHFNILLDPLYKKLKRVEHRSWTESAGCSISSIKTAYSGSARLSDMRAAMGLVALIFGTTSALSTEPEKWCAPDAKLTAIPANGTSDGGWKLEIKGHKAEILTGLHDAIGASLILYDEGEEDRQDNLLFSRDRIFWPCEKNE